MTVGTDHYLPRVLVAEDERVIADTLKLVLDQSGYETCVAYSGDAAVEMARNFQPDIFIADVIMPGMTGIEAAIKVRMTLPSCKILLFSGNTAAVDLIEAARLQNHEFEVLAKPVHPTYLIAKMQSALGEVAEIAAG